MTITKRRLQPEDVIIRDADSQWLRFGRLSGEETTCCMCGVRDDLMVVAMPVAVGEATGEPLCEGCWREAVENSDSPDDVYVRRAR